MFLATPVMRQVARMEFPSTSALTTCVLCCKLRRFMMTLCLTGHVLSRGIAEISDILTTIGSITNF